MSALPSAIARAGLALLGLCSLAAIAATVALFLVPPLAGLDRYVVEGGSMEPTIPRGSMAYERRVPVSSLKPGDVITFVRPGERRPVTHRIVSVDRSGRSAPVLRTRGDANAAVDAAPVRLDGGEQARVAFHVPLVGLPLMALRDQGVRTALAWTVGALLLGSALLGLWREGGMDTTTARA